MTTSPCPTCHNALRKAAAETGAEIKYTWEQPKGKQNCVTYKGKSVPKFKGSAALQLKGAKYNDNSDNKKTTWGVSSNASAGDKYRELKNEKLNAGY